MMGNHVTLKKYLTTLMMQSFEAEATKVLLELTARSVISP